MRTSSIFFRCLKLLGVVALIALAIGLYPSGATAQQAPTSEFQLDGGAGTNTSYPMCAYGPCDTWNTLNPTSSSTNTITSAFKQHQNTQFIGGGSKDPNPISMWACTTKNSPPKDFLTNGYAAAYSAPTTSDLVTIFGGDRSSVSGSSNIGVWFFQKNVQCDLSTGMFSGAHMDGDIFVVSAFTNGGSVSGITVYQWNSTCTAAGSPMASCAAANLQQSFSATTNATCDSTLGANSGALSYAASGTLSNQVACAATNLNAGSTGTEVNWAYPGPGGTGPSFIPGPALFTGGVDVTNLLGKGVCFSSFLIETRSSPTPSSTLKDFIGGNFNVCSISLTKTCPNPGVLNSSGTGWTDTWNVTVCNTSGAPLTNAQVTDTFGGTMNLGSLAPKGQPGACASTNVSTVTNQLSATNTASAKAFFGSLEVDPTVCINDKGTTNGANCTVTSTCNNTVTSEISITKHCAIPDKTDLACDSNGCVVLVPWTAQVCNASTTGVAGQSLVNNISVSDTPQPGANVSIVNNTGFSLSPGDCTGGATTTTACSPASPCPTGYTCSAGGFCVTPPNPSGVYKPTNFDPASTGNSNGRFLFDDTVSVTSATPAIGSPFTPPGSCPNSSDLACGAPKQPCPLCNSTASGNSCGVVLPN